MTASEPARSAETDQRQRIVAALIDTVGRRGSAPFTATEVAEAAGVSEAVFYEHFNDVDDCFDSTCDAALEVLFEPFAKAYATPGPWAERLSIGLRALLASLAKEPRLGELCLVHSQARQRDRHTYHRAVDLLAEALRQGRPTATGTQAPSPRGEELLAGGAIGLIVARLGGGGSEGLEELAPQLAWLLAPSVELEAADWHTPASLS